MRMIEQWHKMVSERNPQGLDDILAEDAILHSPVVHTPLEGKKIVKLYLMAAFNTFLNDTFTYVKEISSDQTCVLEFTAEIDGIHVNGIDMITWNDAGKITEFKVMVRPLQAINLIHKNMDMMLQRLKG